MNAAVQLSEPIQDSARNRPSRALSRSAAGAALAGVKQGGAERLAAACNRDLERRARSRHGRATLRRAADAPDARGRSAAREACEAALRDAATG
jgi:hypothetical protein